MMYTDIGNLVVTGNMVIKYEVYGTTDIKLRVANLTTADLEPNTPL